MFQSLSGSLQASIRFLLHPLPSRDFRPCGLRPTRSYRPLLDSVGLTLLYRLVFCSLLGVIYSAVGLLFTRMLKPVLKILPTYLLVGAYQPYLAHW